MGWEGNRLRHHLVGPPFAAHRAKRKRRKLGAQIDAASKRGFDIIVSASLLVLLAPVIAVVALAIKLESRGPVFYRCRRVGRNGADLAMLKFRKMHHGASGPALVSWDDERFTRLGPFLAGTKLDELPQLWNVLRGQMSLVGPRPEDASFVKLLPGEYAVINTVRPGITGLSQLAFAKESKVLDRDDREGDYVGRILPQKARIDQLYAAERSFGMDLRILSWTALAVLLGREVAVHRETGRLTRRDRPVLATEGSPAMVLERQRS